MVGGIGEKVAGKDVANGGLRVGGIRVTATTERLAVTRLVPNSKRRCGKRKKVLAKEKILLLPPVKIAKTEDFRPPSVSLSAQHQERRSRVAPESH
jgi:hypothetical protein